MSILRGIPLTAMMLLTIPIVLAYKLYQRLTKPSEKP